MINTHIACWRCPICDLYEIMSFVGGGVVCVYRMVLPLPAKAKKKKLRWNIIIKNTSTSIIVINFPSIIHSASSCHIYIIYKSAILLEKSLIFFSFPFLSCSLYHSLQKYVFFYPSHQNIRHLVTCIDQILNRPCR